LKLNKEELTIASILTAIATPFPPMLWAVPVCAFLWALTGSESKYNYKLWRRLGVPLIWASTLWTWQAFLCVPIAFAFLSLGYGLPSTQPPDEGSSLGKVMWKLSGENELLANLLTRGFIYFGILTPFLLVRWLA